MKTVHRGKLPVVLLAAMSGLVMAAELPGRDEYAYSFGLALQGDSEFFTVDIRAEVYHSVSDPNLRDAGVYNADGQPVPRLIERPEA